MHAYKLCQASEIFLVDTIIVFVQFTDWRMKNDKLTQLDHWREVTPSGAVFPIKKRLKYPLPQSNALSNYQPYNASLIKAQLRNIPTDKLIS